MARPPRIDYPGAWHHVVNRGAARRTVFRDTQDHRTFLALLDNDFIEIHAYALMGNHYHLHLRSPEGSMPQAMQMIGLAYSRYFNSKYGKDGPLWKSRYHSTLIADDRYFAAVSRYVHANPVVAGIVDFFGDYQWSSGQVYAGLAAGPPWLHTDFTLAALGGTESYSALMARRHPVDTFVRGILEDSRPGRALGEGVSAWPAA